ncbi:MAG: tyrosine-type recombinase/integrase [Rhodocyclaceae bacterium]|nr:tyrosine-type recombinase/integrase [Rhodocyclaceae bacterium]
MELALVTAQRREDLAGIGPRDVHDGRLWVVQGKTKARVSLPLDLRLEPMGWSVGDIIGRCRDAVVTRHFIHHSARVGRAKPGDKLRLPTITAAFADARDAAGLTWPEGKTPPSFHEIRSLAARLYAEQGIDAQALLGHKSPDMTAVYRDARGADWIRVETAAIR